MILIPKAEFIALLRKRPELALRMLASMSQHLRRIVALLDDLTLKNAEARCIHWLLRHCPIPYEEESCEIELEHPKRIVAAELNITSETLSRTLARLREKQLIRTAGKTILVLNPQRLENRHARASGRTTGTGSKLTKLPACIYERRDERPICCGRCLSIRLSEPRRLPTPGEVQRIRSGLARREYPT